MSTVCRSASPVEWITVMARACLLDKFPGEPLGALVVLHARGLWFEMTTWTVNHLCLDDIVQLHILLWMREFCANDLIDVLRPEFLVAPDKSMRMGKASFLPLYSVHPCTQITKYFAILKQPYQLLLFQVEDPCDEVMPVSAALTFKEAVSLAAIG